MECLVLPPEERPTARELAGTPNSWQCPRCGCRGPHRVVKTYDARAGSERRRRRICRNCGQGLIHTVEVPVSNGYEVQVVRKK